MRFFSILSAATLLASADAFGKKQANVMLKASNSTSNSTSLNSVVLAPSKDPWYTAPANYESATPGTILRLRKAPGNLVSQQQNSSAAYQLLYRTTDSRYNPTFAVTTLFVPSYNLSSSNSQLLAYLVPYDSADVDASPSYTLYQGGLPDVAKSLGKGWYVTVPDFEGPLASFTAGVMSGHATLDAVRAVLNAGLGLSTSKPISTALWGYSGGALAGEWASELAVQYAPDLDICGAALGGLTPNVTSVMETVSGTIYAGLIPAGILGLASQFPQLQQWLSQNLKTSGQYNATYFNMAVNETLVGTIGSFINQNITDYFKNGLASLQDAVPRYVTNTDGLMGYHGVPQEPIFAYKAIGDDISVIADTDKLVSRYCEAGATILYQRNTIGNHEQEEVNGDARAFAWLDSVLNGRYNATGCQIMNVTVNATASS